MNINQINTCPNNQPITLNSNDKVKELRLLIVAIRHQLEKQLLLYNQNPTPELKKDITFNEDKIDEINGKIQAIIAQFRKKG